MDSSPTADQRAALGRFLRARRERLQPAMAGLSAGPRRRTPGLRREDVAQLASVSATWYTWIEQGRDVSVSPQALARLAAALQLSRAERAYLFDLAGRRDPAALSPDSAGAPQPAILDAIAAIAAPAYLLDRGWTARAWNPQAAHLFQGWLDGDADRNLLRYIFLSPLARRLICGWDDRARRVVAELRADTSRYASDPGLRALIDSLSRESPAFARIWAEQAVMGREGGLRTFDHPEDGPLRFQQLTLLVAGQPELKLVILTPLP